MLKTKTRKLLNDPDKKLSFKRNELRNLPLIESDDLLETIFNNVEIGISLVDAEGKFLKVNEALCRFYGRTNAELIGKYFTILVPEQHKKASIEKFLFLLNEGYEKPYEFRVTRDDGAYSDLCVTSQRIYTEGKPVIVSTFSDITQKKKDEQHRKLLESVIINTHDAIIISHAEPIDHPPIVYINSAFTQMTGYNPEDIIGKTADILRGPLTDEKTLAELINKMKNWEPAEVELVNYKKSGEAFWVNFNVVPIKIKSGQFTHWISIQRDITERKKNEENLKAAKVSAEMASKAKADFLSNMSHEIRTPMNAIIGLTDLIMQEDLPIPVMDNLKTVKYSADNLLVIINDILDFSKIEAGKVRLESLDFNIVEIMGQLTKTMGVTACQKGLGFNVNISQTLPELIKGDPFRLNQIMMNLIGNAIKFTQKGDIKVEVKEGKIKNNVVDIFFSVKDSGIGIPKEKLKIIFESFTQAYTDTERLFGGTGLGLSITKKLVRLQGGNITVASEIGKGSEFSFNLKYDISNKNLTEKNKNKMKSEEKDLSGMKILVAEDNKINQMVAKQIFRKWKVDIAVANTGKEAVEMIKNNSYDLVIMDLQMPEMSGIEATKIIRESDPAVLDCKIPILALTADAFGESKQKVLEMGMNDYIVKPFNQDELYEIISKYRKVKA